MRAGRFTQNLHSPSTRATPTPSRTSLRGVPRQSTSQMAVAAVNTPRPIETPRNTFVRVCMDCPLERFAGVGRALNASSAESVERPDAIVAAGATPVSTPPAAPSHGDTPLRLEGGG